MAKQTIMIDFDDTIVESIFLQRVNRFLNTCYTFDNFKDEYYIDNIIPKDKREQFFAEFCDTNPYFEVKIIEDAKEVIQKLNQKYEVYICSGCVMYNMPSKSAQIFAYKYQFLIKTFPFLSPQRFVFTNSKHVLKGDIIIDDYLDNLAGEFKQKYLFSSYHNRRFTEQDLKNLGIKRVKSWKEIAEILL